ncbi:MAG: site-2 protease family protein [Acidimicrobiales bacterium]
MFSSAHRLFTVSGITVKVDLSWLFILGLVAWSYWGQFVVRYDREVGVALVMAAVAAFAFFASVVAHELAHSLEAQRRGVHVAGITLFMFGGVTETSFDVKRPIDEFALTVIGPLTSFALAGAFWLGSIGATGLGWGPAAEVLGVLGWVNLALGAFNLLPGAPLDGGRILRAAVWGATGDRQRSIVVAANAGRVLGGVVIAVGVIQVFLAGLIGGLWFMLIGWFLFRAATSEAQSVEVERLLVGRRAAQFAHPLTPIPADTSIEAAIEEWFLRRDEDAFPVVDGGRLVGAVALDAVRSVRPDLRASTPVIAVATPVDRLPRIDGSAPATDVLAALPEHQLVVVTDENGISLVSPGRAARTVSRLQAMDRRRPVVGARRGSNGNQGNGTNDTGANGTIPE